MKERLKLLIVSLLIIAVAAGIGLMVFNAVRSISYNKNAKNPIVTLSVKDYGDVQIELYPDYAPNTVANFVNLVQNGFYDGKLFHGKEFETIQGADGQATKGTTPIAIHAGMKLVEKSEETTEEENTENTQEVSQEPLMCSYYENNIEANSDKDYEIALEGEFVANDFKGNNLRFEYGTVGLYRNEYEGYGNDLSSYSYNSGSSLFFISTKEDSTLNGMYAAFGKVIKGMEIVERIKELSVKASETGSTGLSYFEDYPVITSATVETFGVDYPAPKYMEKFDYNAYVSNILSQYYGN